MMLDYEEELKKFRPSLEVEDIEGGRFVCVKDGRHGIPRVRDFTGAASTPCAVRFR